MCAGPAAYHEVYRLIYDEIRRYAKEQDIGVVLRDPGNSKSKSLLEPIDPARIDPKDSQAVLQQMNQHVLYVNGIESSKHFDITDAIIERLKSRTN